MTVSGDLLSRLLEKGKHDTEIKETFVEMVRKLKCIVLYKYVGLSEACFFIGFLTISFFLCVSYGRV